jgi:ferredoxin
VRAWIDQDLCTGDGLCTDHCPEVFVLLDDGISYVQEAGVVANDPGGASSTVHVPVRLEAAAIAAALDCPGECIFLEADPVVAEIDIGLGNAEVVEAVAGRQD